MPDSKPTLLLIPGAWHTASAYSLLIPPLTQHSYPVQALTLPSVGSNPPPTSIGPDIQHIRNALIPLLDESKDVIVVMHSYGGIPGGSAVKGLSRKEREGEGKKGGVVALVYICAWIIDQGVSAKAAGGGRGGKGGPSTLRVENNRSTHLDPITAMYHDVPPDVAADIVKGLQPFSTHTLDSPATYAGYKHIPTTYVYATLDRMIPYEKQQDLVKNAGLPITTYVCESSHSPFASMPERVARILRRAAGENITV